MEVPGTTALRSHTGIRDTTYSRSYKNARLLSRLSDKHFDFSSSSDVLGRGGQNNDWPLPSRAESVNFYRKAIYPRLMDRVLSQYGLLRNAALAEAYGRVLEVGFGTGLNAQHYPKAVREVIGLDYTYSPWQRVDKRLSAVQFPISRIEGYAEYLPFNDFTFDCVVTTWTLCSIRDPLMALKEIRRVLRPHGLYLFLEHGRSERSSVFRWQQRLNPLAQRLAGGCHLDLQIFDLIQQADFRILDHKRINPSKLFKFATEMYQGIAHC